MATGNSQLVVYEDFHVSNIDKLYRHRNFSCELLTSIFGYCTRWQNQFHIIANKWCLCYILLDFASGNRNASRDFNASPFPAAPRTSVAQYQCSNREVPSPSFCSNWQLFMENSCFSRKLKFRMWSAFVLSLWCIGYTLGFSRLTLVQRYFRYLGQITTKFTTCMTQCLNLC